MARPRKPTDQKIDAPGRHRGDGKAIVPDRRVDIAVPDPPEGLLPAVYDWWLAFWASPIVAATHADTDVPAVRRLATLMDLRDRAYQVVLETPVVKGSTGQLVEHPLARAMSRYDTEIKALEDRFGLTPRSRLNLGIQLGQAAKQLEDRLDGDAGRAPLVVEVES